ncbi:MAG: magnesium/cobalt transporter CorA [Thermomicrobiales bacterium]
MIVDSAVYIDGKRMAQTPPIADVYEVCQDLGGIAWIGLYKPTEAEFKLIADEFDLHELAIEDAVQAHQRPKLERYGNTLFVVLSAARYDDKSETVEFAELHVFVGPDFVITIRHGDGSELSRARQRLEHDPEMLSSGPEAILYAVLDRVVDDYGPVVRGLENDIDEIEVQVFSGNPGVSRRTYELAREVIEFQRATKPLVGMLNGLIAGSEKYGVTLEMQRYLRDVLDHAIQIQEQVAGFRELLQNILSVNIAVVSIQQNEEMKAMTEASLHQNDEVKKISAWAAILFGPTMIAGIYGMNFRIMPELDWQYGYLFALGLMLAVAVLIWALVKRANWL